MTFLPENARSIIRSAGGHCTVCREQAEGFAEIELDEHFRLWLVVNSRVHNILGKPRFELAVVESSRLPLEQTPAVCERCAVAYACAGMLAGVPVPSPATLCNRTACKRPGALWWNFSTRAYYCEPCAEKINRFAPGLCLDFKPRDAVSSLDALVKTLPEKV